MIQQACPNLAALIEDGAPRAAIRELVKGYVEAMMHQMNGLPPDLVMLGCTHYPLVIDMFRDALPEGIEILSQPERVAGRPGRLSATASGSRRPRYAGRGPLLYQRRAGAGIAACQRLLRSAGDLPPHSIRTFRAAAGGSVDLLIARLMAADTVYGSPAPPPPPH